MLGRHLRSRFLASVKQEGDGAGDDEEGHQGAHDAPDSNRSVMERRHLGSGFCLHPSLEKSVALGLAPLFYIWCTASPLFYQFTVWCVVV
jgi:hypothetical protein